MNDNDEKNKEAEDGSAGQEKKKTLLKKSARKIYSLCAFAFAAASLIVFAAKAGLGYYFSVHPLPEGFSSSSPGMKLLMSAVPNYLVFLPVIGLLLMTLPAAEVKKRTMRLPDLLSFLVMAFPVAFIGNLIGNAISAFAAGAVSRNPVSEAVTGGSPVAVIILVIVAPVLEELVFRKWLLDRISPLGGGAAIVFSSLCFAMFHNNVVQFFYAFGIGLIFGYVYLRSGSLLNVIILHCAVNLFGGVIAPFAFSLPDWDTLSQISSLSSQGLAIPDSMVRDVLPGLAGFVGYIIVFVLLIAAGIIAFVQKSNELRLPRREISLSAGENVSVMFLNAGMVVFVIISVVFSVRNLLGYGF